MANEKHIFIGIGGSGVKTVSQIKSKVYEKRFPSATAQKTRLQAMNDSYRFLFLDTDQRDIDEANKRNRESFEHGNVPFISPQTDLINLGRANPQAIYYEARQEKEPKSLINKRILEACSPQLASMIPDQPLSFGAGAFRIKSRIAFAHSLADFQSKLSAAISSLNDVKTVGGEDCIIYYWVVGSTVGGTGSGIFNDVLYHVNQLHHQIVGNGDPQLVLTMYMPKVYIDSNSTEEKYSLNAFAVFSELEAFKKMSYNDNQKTVMHRLAFNNDYCLVNTEKRYCPFYYLIPVDIQTDKGTSLGIPNTMYRNTAEMLYHLHQGQAGATFRSDLDNYMNDIMEKNHEEFLVPMGYVSLQKPQEQYAEYMRSRFRRDLLRSWLICDNEKQAKVAKEDVEALKSHLFEELNPEVENTIANSFLGYAGDTFNKLRTVDLSSEKMDDDLAFSFVSSTLDGVANTVNAETIDDSKRNKYKKLLVDGLWRQAEKLIIEHGLAYTYNAILEVRKSLRKDYESDNNGDSSISRKESELNTLRTECQSLSDKAEKIDFGEKITKTNKKQIDEYTQAALRYATDYVNLQIKKWAHDILRDFCMDEKNDELSLLARHINGMLSKANDINREAVKYYKKLSTKFGDAAMDVTTVYLPMLKDICDGNGWKPGNFFSKLYTKIIKADEDAEETPSRKDLMEFLNKNIYLTADEEVVSQKYKVVLEKKKLDEDSDEEPKKDIDTRFFANPVLRDKGNVTPEKIIEDFIKIATILLEKEMKNNADIQENWDNRKISEFFSDLTNDQKDEVRRALNPALFFSYNNSRIDVTKKEEHVVFVAGNEDLATEMLGFQKGNTKHRFESCMDENTALVLKSKFGLSLEDYRIYDAIKTVYDNASFREKYHFHHDFAQYLDKITIEDLPYEVLPQHYTFVKMMILDAFKEELKPLFFEDEYDKDAYTYAMYYSDYDESFKIALPEALMTGMDLTKGQIALRKESDGRDLFLEIEGTNFAARFEKYKEEYHNSRFGETTESLIQAILRTRLNIKGGETVDGESILKKDYTKKQKELLKKFNENKQQAALPEEKRLWSIFFNILRQDYDTVNKFKKE